MNVRFAFIAFAAVVAATVAGSAPRASSRSSHRCVKGPEVRFQAADRTRLVGHKFGAGGTAIVLAHGNGSDLCQWGLTRPSGFTIGPDGAFYVSNRGASSGIGEVLRIEP